MKKMKRTKIGGMMGIVVIGLILIPTTDAAILWGPYITDTNINSTTINWKTENATLGMVKYATDEYYTEHGNYDRTVEDAENKQLHHVAITNLTPNTVYHYQLIIGNESTSDHTFRTFTTNDSFTFVVYGDTREQTGLFTQMERHKLVADRIAEEENVSFVVHTGDFVCTGSDLDEWNRFFDAGRAMMANTTIYPALGNHEGNHTNYYDIFGVPEWYSFDCVNAHFTVLDSNDWASPHTAWLRNDLNTGATWKFVSFHHPIYSSDERHWGGWKNDVWENIFINNSVDAVFNGHVHVYERYEENGIQYVVVGCGGAPLYNLKEEKIPGYQSSFEHTLGYARITIEGNKATMDVIKVADVSGDNKNVTYIYPPDTIFETVVLRQTKTWYVDDSGGADFLTIQAAVNAANEGDTIIVRDGTYTENVVVNKSLTIKSENGSYSTLVQPAEEGLDVFKVSTDYVNISGFTVTGLGPLTYDPDAVGEVISQGIDIYHSNHCTIAENTVLGCSYGIHLLAASNSIISNNNCSGNRDHGIKLDTSSSNTVSKNICSGTWHDDNIDLTSSSNNTISGNICVAGLDDGIFLSDSSNNQILDNTCENNSECGIHGSGSSNTISNNICNDSIHGIYIGSGNTVTYNTVSNNSGYGIWIAGSNSKVYVNNLINSGVNAHASSGNIWNSTELIEYGYSGKTYTNYMGNYWEDYTGNDTDGDGIGDTPYDIPGGTDKDYHPLMEPFENYFGEALPPPPASLTATANVKITMVGISLNRTEIDYGSVVAGQNSDNESIEITNIGTSNVDVTLEVTGETTIAQSFYEQSLHVDYNLYNPATMIAQIPAPGSEDVVTQIRVPSDWTEAGTQGAMFVFWAEV